MADKEYFVQGNEACALGALAAGCRFFAGYPITPSTEIAEIMSKKLPTLGGHFIQMEDEISAIGAIIGAAWGGQKVVTATSGPGISLMQENIGYAAMTETPIVIINMQRGSPSTGQPTRSAQADMMQARWGSHGDYETIALTPSSVQECFDFTVQAFNLAEKYRCPVFVMADEIVGHMREKIIIPEKVDIIPRQMPEKTDDIYLPYDAPKNGTTDMPSFGQGFNIHVTGLTHDKRGYPSTDDPEVHSDLVTRLCDKILKNSTEMSMIETEYLDDAETIVLSYGIPTRSALTAVKKARNHGLKVGYIKLGLVWPFPEEKLLELTKNAKKIIVPELNLGQIYYEVDRVLGKHAKVELLSKIGGALHTPTEILDKIMED
ncbi:2-oxoacid:acceptor oxidoreductase subunit alpha [Methanosphaera sp. WGK6]|uniref:2-oxoacid:acceptor oxidoreductase subunit alpha n=1 Tax=Methanosphaera sp. WGK6 TaxID=1561964 RepID=UPI00084CE2D7|nr:2-oxoacid:acceptor oxidoreductase subunit alpha [Methanosphaera sp. WGK6]OED30734.1 2-oxoglutarate ferredoxin oxidoreductase subunit alpha [Methanosphaera sp. WGK6]